MPSTSSIFRPRVNTRFPTVQVSPFFHHGPVQAGVVATVSREGGSKERDGGYEGQWREKRGGGGGGEKSEEQMLIDRLQ